MTPIHEAPRSWWRSIGTAARIAAARLRFFLLLGVVLLVVGTWPTLRNLWDTLTRPPSPEAAVSPDTEYWCPMCPGVASDWPGKCPVCHMTLVRRLKGEMTPLPDGVVSRMQFSPYRVQLAGIHTSTVEFRPLARTVVVAGFLEPPEPTSEDGRLFFAADVFEMDSGLLRIGQEAKVTTDAFPGQVFRARLAWLAPQLAPATRSLRVRLEIENLQTELRPGMVVAGKVHVLLANQPNQHGLALEVWRDRASAELFVGSMASQLGPAPGCGLRSFLEAVVCHAAQHQGLLLAVPESAVIDTGARKVVFLEQSPGLFDGVEVRLGRRCGDFYPVLGGLEPGHAVVTAGAFLLDAETRLNPAAAAGYFGAGSRIAKPSATPVRPSPPARLSADDQKLIEVQRICPVTDELLGSMGPPVRVIVEGHVVLVCCEACTPTIKKNPGKYLEKLANK